MVLGSGTSGTVFKMNFKRKDVAVKQIAKSDDKDEMKVSLHLLYLFFINLKVLPLADPTVKLWCLVNFENRHLRHP